MPPHAQLPPPLPPHPTRKGKQKRLLSNRWKKRRKRQIRPLLKGWLLGMTWLSAWVANHTPDKGECVPNIFVKPRATALTAGSWTWRHSCAPNVLIQTTRVECFLTTMRVSTRSGFLLPPTSHSTMPSISAGFASFIYVTFVLWTVDDSVISVQEVKGTLTTWSLSLMIATSHHWSSSTLMIPAMKKGSILILAVEGVSPLSLYPTRFSPPFFSTTLRFKLFWQHIHYTPHVPAHIHLLEGQTVLEL